MALLLNIDTALETASVCLSTNDKIIALEQNDKQQDHAAWLHGTIDRMLKTAGFQSIEINGVAVSIGPGSYTGLRVGLSAAKGFCYALNIPLITVSTLELIAFAVKDEAVDLICPLIDARRMEVFMALYDKNMTKIAGPGAMIIDSTSFMEQLTNHKILFCGNGRKKLQELILHSHAHFTDTRMTAQHLSQLAYQLYKEEQFADLAYTEPLYIKEFYSPARKV